MINTGEIRLSSKKVLLLLFQLHGKLWLWITLIGLAAFICLAIICDPRFYILSLIWIFLFIPLVISFLYFVYGMKPLTAFNAIPHKLSLDNDEITISFIEKKEEEKKEMIKEPNNDSKEEEAVKSSSKIYKVNLKTLKEIIWQYDSAVLLFNKDGWLFVPFNCFTGSSELNEALSYLKLYSNDR